MRSRRERQSPSFPKVDRECQCHRPLLQNSLSPAAAFSEPGSLFHRSDTVHELPELKDGASWAALEYAKNLRDPATNRTLSNGKPLAREPQDVVICIAGISYSDKTKYRACAVMQCVCPDRNLGCVLRYWD